MHYSPANGGKKRPYLIHISRYIITYEMQIKAFVNISIETDRYKLVERYTLLHIIGFAGGRVAVVGCNPFGSRLTNRSILPNGSRF